MMLRHLTQFYSLLNSFSSGFASYNNNAKLFYMETNSKQQEVLLITGTTFSSRQFSEKDNSFDNKLHNEREKLEEACINGLLQEMLPELNVQSADSKKVYLWGIKEANSFIDFEYGELPEETDKYFSLDPYSFLKTKSFN
jgi:hypothetical protein